MRRLIIAATLLPAVALAQQPPMQAPQPQPDPNAQYLAQSVIRDQITIGQLQAALAAAQQENASLKSELAAKATPAPASK